MSSVPSEGQVIQLCVPFTQRKWSLMRFFCRWCSWRFFEDVTYLGTNNFVINRGHFFFVIYHNHVSVRWRNFLTLQVGRNNFSNSVVSTAAWLEQFMVYSFRFLALIPCVDARGGCMAWLETSFRVCTLFVSSSLFLLWTQIADGVANEQLTSVYNFCSRGQCLKQ